jgi:hypothetical protein
VRNSSLVEWCCTDNSTGLKSATEAMVRFLLSEGRGALLLLRSPGVSQSGALASENDGMSSVKACGNHVHRKSEVSYARLIRVGLVGPKLDPEGEGDGQCVNIHIPSYYCYGKGETQEDRLSVPNGHGAFPT